MVLAVVRSHYGEDQTGDRERVYRAGNALAGWLGFDSWIDIVAMQNPENVEELRAILRAAK